MLKLSEIFDVKYGVNLELNKMTLDQSGTNFVSRTAKNNGVSARVRLLEKIQPIPAGTISVAGGGSVMESFLQPSPYYSGRDLYYLTAKVPLTDQEKLFYCLCIRANKYRFNYGRQANRTLKDISLPSPNEIPDWVKEIDLKKYNDAKRSVVLENFNLSSDRWSWFEIKDLFEVKKGKRLTKFNMRSGNTPYIGAIDSNNGCRQYIDHSPMHEGNTITVNYNGSVGEAFYQPLPYWATDDVNVLYPKFKMNKFSALFICAVVRFEKYRFNYGRKWHVERMLASKIKLPISSDSRPDFAFMEEYIKSLPYSSQL